LKSNLRPNNGNKIYTVNEIIIGGGGLFSTNSMIFPTKLTKKLPCFYENAPIGDYPLTIYLSLMGTVYYIDEFMSAYRVGVSGSWTVTNLATVEKFVKFNNKVDNMLNEVDLYTEKKYEDIIHKTIIQNRFKIYLMQGKRKELKKSEFRELYNNLDKNNKIKLWIKQYCPFISKIANNIKGSNK
jgi:hypothetical protein